MTDVELTRALERGEIASENFHHVSYLHVAWVYLAESSSVQQAATKMRNTLSRFAAAAGTPQKYHETVCTPPVEEDVWTTSCMQFAIAGKEFSTRLLFDRAAFQ